MLHKLMIQAFLMTPLMTSDKIECLVPVIKTNKINKKTTLTLNITFSLKVVREKLALNSKEALKKEMD